jgi:hypothetical protein
MGPTRSAEISLVQGPTGCAAQLLQQPVQEQQCGGGPTRPSLFDDDEETWACRYSIDDVIDDDCDAKPSAAGNGGAAGAIAALQPGLQDGPARDGDALAAGRQLQPHPHPMLAAALSYAERGWDIFPAPPGKKKSYKSEKYSNGAKWGKTRGTSWMK